MKNSIKFNTVLDEVSTVIPKYRRIIFKTAVTGLLISELSKCISGLYRFFEAVMLSDGITRKRFYQFIRSEKIPIEKIWIKLFKMLGENIYTDGRVLISLDDTVYAKTGKKISGCDVHYDHSAKINSSKYVYGHCRVVLGIQKFIHGRWACLPVRQSVYRLRKSVESEKFKTKIEIAGTLIRELCCIINAPMLIVSV